MAAHPTIVVDGEASVVIDDSLWPILIVTWFGHPSEVLVEKYFAEHGRQLQRARSGKERLVLITDTFATERPSAIARKRIVELTEAQGELAQRVVLRNYIVIENPVIRGVVTALAWIYPKMAEAENLASPRQALEKAVEALRSVGIPSPVGFTPNHPRPERPRRG